MPTAAIAADIRLDALPEELAAGLLQGTAGKVHLMGRASAALSRAGSDPAMGRLGVDLLLGAWEAAPVDGALAGQLAQLLPEDALPELSGVLRALARLHRPDPALSRLGAMPVERALARLDAQLEQSGPSLHALRLALELGAGLRPPAWTERLFDAPWPKAAAPALELARADFELACGQAEQARTRLARLQETLPLPGVAARLGECLRRLGERDAALDLWRDALAARPWDVTLTLKAHDLAKGVDSAVRPLPAPANVFIYTWNKAGDLDRCLESLAASRLGAARITLLDNGSSDETPEVARAWQERLGGKRLKTLRLPVNVGAPAARNWLMHLEGAALSPFSAYLDDDALVEPDWLERLGAAAAHYPEAGVWGCKVVDAASPALIQAADLHAGPEPGRTSDLHQQGPDTGGFDYLRPCLSVTGCCHLFRTELLLENGGFDIAFSPSQFDDLDHDLRLALEGRLPVYQGHLCVRHIKRSGKLSRAGGAALATARANHDKLRARYQKTWARLQELETSVLRADVRAKRAALELEQSGGKG